jgi:hypothetical protein
MMMVVLVVVKPNGGDGSDISILGRTYYLVELQFLSVLNLPPCL